MSNKVYIGIIAALTALCVWLAFGKYNATQQTAQVQTEKNEAVNNGELLALELEQIKMGYDTLETDNAEMAARIADQQAQLETLIKKSRNKDADISKLRAEADVLRKIMRG